MKPCDIRLEEYLRGELPATETVRVEEHLAVCPTCRQQADWLETLRELVGRVRQDPPEEVVAELNQRLLPVPRYPGRSLQTGTWAGARTLAPLLRAAALLLVGIALGVAAHQVWSGSPTAIQTLPIQAEAPTAEPVRLVTAGLEPEGVPRPQDVERIITSLYLSRVEATLIGFLTAAAQGTIEAPGLTTFEDLLSTTANLKADCKTTDDIRMARLLGQIESVLMEMERLQRERDLPGARHVASLIEEQGLLSTLHRAKIEVEE